MKYNTTTFIEKAQLKHNNYYDYSKVNYKGSNKKVDIVCPVHGVFSQEPRLHLSGAGCYFCGIESRNLKNTYSLSDFIEKAKIVHGSKYDYSKVDYTFSIKSIEIICPIHGSFFQIPSSHLRGKGCFNCGKEQKRLNTQKFIALAKKVHNGLYDYSCTIYSYKNKIVSIICKIHGVFKQRHDVHLSGSGCPTCKSSKGEKIIQCYLENKNIYFEAQKRFKECRYKYPLPFDFYIPKYSLFIEYNGIQHYKFIDFFHCNENGFNIQKEKDEIKKKFAFDNGYYIEISSKEEVFSKLDNFLTQRQKTE